MFATIRRHQKWLWLVVIVGVIVPFVLIMDPTYSGRGTGAGRGGGGNFGYVNGRPITREEFSDAYAEARLQFFFYARSWPEENEMSRQMFDADRQVTERLFMIEQLRGLNIEANDAAVADWIAQIFRDERGVLNLESYRQFVERGLRRGGLTEADFRRFARHEVGIRQLYKLGGMTGSLISPREAAQAFRQENEQITAEIALFSLSNHLAEVLVTPEALGAYFTNQEARYRVPEKVQVSYVRFASSNYLAEADQQLSQRTNLNAELDALYRQRGPDSFKDPANVTMPEEAAKRQLREEQRKLVALGAAHQNAMAFAEELYGLFEKQPGQLDNLERLAAAKNLLSAVSESFTRMRPPAGLGLPTDFAQKAFDLSTNQPMIGEPILSEEAVYIVTLKDRIPSRPSTLEEVRITVTTDFRQAEAREMALRAAQKFHAAVTNGLAEGRTFGAICQETGVQPIKPPAFSRASQTLPELAGRVDLNQLQEVVGDLQAGESSDLRRTRDGAMVVHVAARQPVDEKRLKDELPEFLETLREQQRRQAFEEWFRHELEMAQISGLPELGSSRRR